MPALLSIDSGSEKTVIRPNGVGISDIYFYGLALPTSSPLSHTFSKAIPGPGLFQIILCILDSPSELACFSDSRVWQALWSLKVYFVHLCSFGKAGKRSLPSVTCRSHMGLRVSEGWGSGILCELASTGKANCDLFLCWMPGCKVLIPPYAWQGMLCDIPEKPGSVKGWGPMCCWIPAVEMEKDLHQDKEGEQESPSPHLWFYFLPFNYIDNFRNNVCFK